MRIQQLTEQPRRVAAIAFGRMNPPTIGHAKLVDVVKSQAGDPYIFLSQSQKPKTDPLSFEQKIGFAKAFFPGVTVGDPEVRTIFDALNKIYAMGYTDLVYVAGSDRVQQFTDLINKYNGQEDFYSFDSIQVVSAGERDPDAQGAEGMSASKMRAAATAGDFEAFKSGTPNQDMAQNMYDAVRTGMGMMESLERIVRVLETLAALNNVKPLNERVIRATGVVIEAWSEKYKRSIDCDNPKGFSQRAHCQGRKKNEDIEELDEGWWEDLKAKAQKYWNQLTGGQAQASIPPAKLQDFQKQFNNWLEPQIQAYSKTANISSQLLHDRLKAESNFKHWGGTAPAGNKKPDPNKVTRGDLNLKDQAVGIGQIRKPALDDVNRRYGTNIKPEELENAQTNLYVSSRYLGMLKNEYYKKYGKHLTDDPEAYAYVAYRYGPKVPDSAKSEIEAYIASKKQNEGAAESIRNIHSKLAEGFSQPRFDVEWEEANRYPEFRKIGKEAWIELAKTGRAVTITDASDIENTDAADPDSFKSLDPNKQKRALAQLEKDNVEMPIVAVYSDGYKELIGGNTRLTAMMAKNGQATIWQFEVPDSVAELAQGVAEGKSKEGSYLLQLERDDDMLVLHIKSTKTGQRTEVRGKPNYDGDGYDATDPLHQLLDKVGKAANISELMNGEVVSINPKHPDGKLAKDTVRDIAGESITEVTIDNKNGRGAVPNNMEVDYFGKKVMMKPSTFIKLASKLGKDPDPEMIDYIKKDGAIGAPFLTINVPWDEDDDSKLKVRGHEGRNRMLAILKAEGDAPVETHLFFAGKYNRARHLEPEFIAAINKELVSQDDQLVKGPLFTEIAGESITEAGVGRVTRQNQTSDVGPSEIKKQAKKMGFSVDKDGRPPLLHKTAAKNSDPNTLFNLGLAEGQLNEKGSIGIPLSSGMTVVIAPHRPLKVKKSKKKVKLVGAGGEE